MVEEFLLVIVASIHYKMKNKKGLSGIVAAVIMIALVMVVAGIVWGVVTNLVSERLEDAGTCLDVLGTLSLQGQYTCHDTSADELYVSIGVGEVDLEKIIISISGAGSSSSYELNDTSGSPQLKNYTGGTLVKMPEKNSGLTYRLPMADRPDEIRLIPVIAGQQCDVADSTTIITSCSLI